MSNNKCNVVVLGVTGGIACGKSEVGRFLGELGFDVCDADLVAHGLMKKGTPLYQQLVNFFGNHILSDDDEISRPILGGIIFDNPMQREALNRFVHPVVREALEGWITERHRQGCSGAVLVPLLFESGMDTLDLDAVLCVSCPEELVFRRLEKRGLNRVDAERRIDAQMPLEDKERRADFTVPNAGTLQELKEETRKAVEEVYRLKGRL
ncbi:MAG: dephospho-CoA kinase [Verrucomicrobia bacterium]|nr:MAG: dephospho-CoA kinase [Verrucomicrobiota bacterium]